MAWTMSIAGTSRLTSANDMTYKESLFEGADSTTLVLSNPANVFDSTFGHNEAIVVGVEGNTKTTCYVDKVDIDNITGRIIVTGKEKIAKFQEIYPKEATVAGITTKKRSAIIRWLVITQAHGNGVTVVNVQDSPAGINTITEEFPGTRSLYDIINRYSIEDNYQFKIEPFTDTGAIDTTVNKTNGTTELTYDGTTTTFDTSDFVGGKLTFTSGSESGNSFIISANTSTVMTVTGDASGASDNDTFTLTSQDLHYKPRTESYYTTDDLIYGTDPISSFDVPDNAVDIINKQVVYGKQDTVFTVASIGGSGDKVITINETIVADEWIGGVVVFTTGTPITTTTWLIDDNATNTLTVDADASALSADDKITISIYAIAEDGGSQSFYADGDGNKLIKEGQPIVDKTLNTPQKCQDFVKQYIREHAWALQNIRARLYGYNDLKVGQLIYTKYPADGSKIDDYLLVTEVQHNWRDNSADVKLTYYEKDIQHIIMEMIDRMRKRDAEVVTELTYIPVTLSQVSTITLDVQTSWFSRIIDDSAFIIGTDIVGNNKVASFNGTNSSISHATYWDVVPTQYALYVQFMMPDGWSSAESVDDWILSKRNDSGNRFCLNLMASDGKLRFFTEQANAGNKYIFSTQTSWTAGQWYQALITQDTTNGKRLYVDGDLDSSDPAETTLWGDGTDYDFSVGIHYPGGPTPFKGLVAEVVGFEEVLDATDVTNIFAGNFYTSTTPTLHWNMNKEDGTYVYDQTNNNVEGTLANITMIGDNLSGESTEVEISKLGDLNPSSRLTSDPTNADPSVCTDANIRLATNEWAGKDVIFKLEADDSETTYTIASNTSQTFTLSSGENAYSDGYRSNDRYTVLVDNTSTGLWGEVTGSPWT